VFASLPVWLAAENGAVVRPPDTQEWMTVMETSGGEWKESVQLVLEYFCERTPRSFVEQRGTSLVWNYKYADVEFGRIQARDLLQHLLTGPISNAPVDIVRGAKSIEVRPVGVSKGSSMERILQLMHTTHDISATDFVLVAGHFLARDENVFTLYEGQRSFPAGAGVEGSLNTFVEEDDGGPLKESLKMLEEEDLRSLGGVPTDTANGGRKTRRTPPGQMDLPFQLPPKHLFTCTVGRSMASKAK
jgi:trehalose-6-phosphatase